MSDTSFATHQAVPSPEPMAYIDTSAPDLNAHENDPTSLVLLNAFATQGGDISDLLGDGVVERLGVDAIREWRIDQGTRAAWLENADKYLAIAAQDRDDDRQAMGAEAGDEWGADINYPILATSCGQFLARAAPELIRGDKVVGVKVFSPPSMQPDPLDIAKAAPQPQNEQQAQLAMQQIQADQQKTAMVGNAIAARNARAERVKHFMNFLIFYRMDDWEGESDLLLLQASAIGVGFKKVYMSDRGLRSDFCSATCLTVHNNSKNLHTCPRITQEFETYPNEIAEKQRAGTYRDVVLAREGDDPQKPRLFIEQHRLDDLDGDGLQEPYVVTVDAKTEQVLRVEPAYTDDDIIINEATGQVIRIDRWQPFARFPFLPDPRGRFYAIGLGALLDALSASIDTTINQLIDAGTAQIAGGGFIGSGVRLQGSGQGGSAFWRPGEYQTVGTPGINLQQAIWERTVPGPSQVAFNMMEFLLAAAKDIASVKDVITGEAPNTAPVGTTLALQNQALQVFSSIYKRIYRGFHDEFRLMYRTLKRHATDKEKREYQELTGGDFDADFSGDGTDIEPVADPTVVTKQQKIAKYQSVLQIAESPIGAAAGMQTPGPAQALVKDILDVFDVDRPERFVGPVSPDPEMVASAQDKQASAQLKGVQAAKVAAEVPGIAAKTNLTQAQTIKTVGESAINSHGLHVEADRIHKDDDIQPPPEPEPKSAKS